MSHTFLLVGNIFLSHTLLSILFQIQWRSMLECSVSCWEKALIRRSKTSILGAGALEHLKMCHAGTVKNCTLLVGSSVYCGLVVPKCSWELESPMHRTTKKASKGCRETESTLVTLWRRRMGQKKNGSWLREEKLGSKSLSSGPCFLGHFCQEQVCKPMLWGK